MLSYDKLIKVFFLFNRIIYSLLLNYLIKTNKIHAAAPKIGKDIKTLNLKDIEDNLIKMDRAKTGNKFVVPLLPQALELIDKYADYENTSKPIFPVLSNQKMNSNLKLIQEIVGINKSLTTHIGRQTCATSITLANGVPIETVSKMLGHTKIATTQVYAKVLDDKIIKDMDKLKDRF